MFCVRSLGAQAAHQLVQPYECVRNLCTPAVCACDRKYVAGRTRAAVGSQVGLVHSNVAVAEAEYVRVSRSLPRRRNLRELVDDVFEVVLHGVERRLVEEAASNHQAVPEVTSSSPRTHLARGAALPSRNVRCVDC